MKYWNSPIPSSSSEKVLLKMSNMDSEEYVQLLHQKYPCWDRKTLCINEDVLPQERIHRIILEGNIHYDDIYNLPIYQMNMAALQGDWNAFMFMLGFHGLEISPAALFIAHCFQRLDLCSRIVKEYGFEQMAQLTHGYHKHLSLGSRPMHYIWCGGIYENPLLYQMYVQGYEKRKEYLKSWWGNRDDGFQRDLNETNYGGWNSTYVGFLHPEMKDTLHIKHLDRYYGSTLVFPYYFKHDRENSLKYIDNTGGRFPLHDISRFYCITPELIDIRNEFGDSFTSHTYHAYWLRGNESLRQKYKDGMFRKLESSIILESMDWTQEELDKWVPTMIF